MEKNYRNYIVRAFIEAEKNNKILKQYVSEDFKHIIDWVKEHEEKKPYYSKYLINGVNYYSDEKAIITLEKIQATLQVVEN